MPDEAFLTCPCCGHSYKSEAELVETFNAVGKQREQEAIAKGWTPIEFRPVDDAGQIWFCPLCMHDL